MPDNLNIVTVLDPESMQEQTISTAVTENKPFNRCLHCEFLGTECSGPNLNAMSVERACEFLQIRRVQLKYSYQKTADIAMLSVITVKRILTGKIKDPSFLSMQALTFALVADPKGKYPCAMHLLSDDAEQAVKEFKDAQEDIVRKDKELEEEKKKVAYLKHQVEFKEQQMLAKDQQLKERTQFIKTKDRAIAILSILLFLAMGVIITALIVDSINPDVGFFWNVLHPSAKNIFELLGL